MSPQKDDTIIKQTQKSCMEGEVSLWTLESPTITSRTESLSASIATSMDTWQKNADQRKKNIKLGNVLNVRKKNTLPKTAKEYSQ